MSRPYNEVLAIDISSGFIWAELHDHEQAYQLREREGSDLRK
jgi:hypothetical protein